MSSTSFSPQLLEALLRGAPFALNIVRASDKAVFANGSDARIPRSSANGDGAAEGFRQYSFASVVDGERFDIRLTLDNAAECEREQELLRLALFDDLTGLPNHTMLAQVVAAEINAGAAEPFALAILDLDGFQKINEYYGVDTADRLVVAVAERLSWPWRTSLTARILAVNIIALGLLAGGIAHDFNNLLLVIQLYTDIIRKSRGSDLFSAEMAEIANAVERARSMTRHLLTFSRQQPTELSVLDAADIVEDVYSMLRRTLPANIEISTLIAEDLHPILVDRGQMEQVLMNLAINARDAMPEGGRFTISLENATVKAGSVTLEPGDYVQMRVSDTGSGIAAEHLPRIFEPFFTTKPRGQGTGLGLANCYAIIVQAGGQISVESTVGAGTGFLILLPCTKHAVENDADGADGVAEADDAGSETILVVEDDQAVSRATCRILESSGYKVLCAANGDEAKRTLERDGVGIDMVLSDVVMPQLGGTELAEYIASHFPYLPIVFMTGYSDHPIAQQDGAMTIGGHPAILKPFQPHDLTGLVREALDRRVSRAAS